MTDTAFSQAGRDAIYRAIAERRDMRHFTGGTVEPALLRRLLEAAHQAPSVGLMQPWRFIRISDRALRGQIRELVEQARIRTAGALGEPFPAAVWTASATGCAGAVRVVCNPWARQREGTWQLPASHTTGKERIT